MVSFYKYLGAHKGVSFRQFLMGDFLRQLWKNKYWFVRPQFEFIYDASDGCLVDYVGRFEFLAMAMDHVGRQVGLQDASLPHVNRSSGEIQPRSSAADRHVDTAAGHLNQEKAIKEDYRAYYDDESISRVATLYERDIEMFGYEFDPLPRDHAVEVPMVK
jgi:hypothetical protein